MAKDLNAVVATIAKKHLRIDTLLDRHSDRLDFHELHVNAIRDALAAAYNAGFAAGSAHGTSSLKI